MKAIEEIYKADNNIISKETVYRNIIPENVINVTRNVTETPYVIEQLNGIIDNENKLFTAYYNVKENSEIIYMNGIKLHKPDDYTINNYTVTFSEAPSNVGFDDYLEIIYMKA